MDVKTLIEKSKSAGLTTIPASSGNNAEAEQALTAIFEASPKLYFQSRTLKKLLTEAGIECPKIGNVLFQMKHAKKVENPSKGNYRLAVKVPSA